MKSRRRNLPYETLKKKKKVLANPSYRIRLVSSIRRRLYRDDVFVSSIRRLRLHYSPVFAAYIETASSSPVFAASPRLQYSSPVFAAYEAQRSRFDHLLLPLHGVTCVAVSCYTWSTADHLLLPLHGVNCSCGFLLHVVHRRPPPSSSTRRFSSPVFAASPRLQYSSPVFAAYEAQRSRFDHLLLPLHDVTCVAVSCYTWCTADHLLLPLHGVTCSCGFLLHVVHRRPPPSSSTRRFSSPVFAASPRLQYSSPVFAAYEAQRSRFDHLLLPLHDVTCVAVSCYTWCTADHLLLPLHDVTCSCGFLLHVFHLRPPPSSSTESVFVEKEFVSL